ncbi:MAG: protein kinase [Polyangiaceae bacterium]|nr:protein kinase [Polyangiaceae bacterium]MCL4750896.1 protein kinase [Myxococcales bacterium]
MKRGEVVGGRFEVRSLAGSGAMGVVWRSLDRQTGDAVALKLLRPGSESERFLRESRLLAELDHPGIVRYVAHGNSDEGPYLVMEWLEGESLAQRLERAELSATEAVRVVTGIASAIGAAHRRMIVHRDLKPSNVFLVNRSIEDVRVLDFGVARQGALAGDLTRTGVIVGSPRYMAPEQARGAKDVGPAADVWALGAILFRCLTGHPILPDGPMEVILSELLLSPIPRVSDSRKDVPPELDELVGRLLSKEPGDRPADGDAVARALAALQLEGDLDAPLSQGARDGAVLTLAEQRFTCVVLVSGLERAVMDAPPFDLRALAEKHGGTLERRGESRALVFATLGTASDVVAQAARAALEIRRHASGVTLALATGAGPVGDLANPERSVVTRAEALIDQSASGIFLDQVSTGLLESRFQIERRPGAAGSATLLGERLDPTPLRRLLGRSTPCVGRERELSVLESLLTESLSESVARVALVTGNSGVGKSRVRYELLRRLEATARSAGSRPPEIWLGRGDPMAEGSPFGLLSSALRFGLGVSLDTPRDEVRDRLAARVGKAHSPHAAGRVADTLADVVAGEVEARSAMSPVSAGDLMLTAWEDFLSGELDQHPILLVLEDLHWSDWGSVRFVDAALRQHADRPLFALGLARPDVTDRFPGLWAERRPLVLPLGELGRRASESLVQTVLGEDVAPSLVAAIVERAGGNAFFLEELIRAVAESGPESALPGSVLAVAEARLAALDPELRQLLRAASIFGQVFWPAGVAELLGRHPDSVRADLARLGERELVSRRRGSRFGSVEEYVFRHAFVRETAYSMLTEEDLRLGHRLAAAWLERAGEREALVLGEHWHRGGELGRAAPHFCRAAEAAIRGNDFEHALVHARRALEARPSGELAGELYLLMSQAHQWRGEAEERESAARQAMGAFPRLSPRWYVAAAETARIASRAGRHDEVSALFAEVAADTAPETAAARAVVLAQLCVPALRAGRTELAGEILACLAEIESHLAPSDHEGRGWIARAEGYAALVAGDAATYLEKTELAARCFEEANEERHALTFQTSVGFAHIALGQYAQAEAILRDVLARAERMNLALTRAIAKHNLGYAVALAGDLAAGIAIERDAIADAVSQHDRWIECVSHTYLAALLSRAGKHAEALASALKSAELSDRPNRVLALALAARAELGRGDPSAALGHATESHYLLEELGSIEDGEGLARLTWVEVLRANGEREKASAALDRAQQRLRERADKISDPALRRSFLENVPEHRETLSLALT